MNYEDFKRAVDSMQPFVIPQELKDEWEKQRKEREEKQEALFKQQFKETKIISHAENKRSYWTITVHDPILLKKIYDAIRERSLELGFEEATQSQMYGRKPYKQKD